MFEYQDINMYVRILTSLPAYKYLYVDLTRKVERIEQELKTYTDELNVLRKYKVHRFGSNIPSYLIKQCTQVIKELTALW